MVLAARDPLIRAGVAALLAGAGYSLVLETGSADALRSWASGGVAELALVDLGLCDGAAESTDLVVSLLATCPGLAVMVLVSDQDSDSDRLRVLEVGAAGLLDRSEAELDIVAALRAAGSGLSVFTPGALERIVRLVGCGSVAPSADACGHAVGELTPRELEVLALIGTGLANAEIADELYVSEATVKTHVSNILTELELPTRAQAVVAAYEAGVVRPSSPAGST